MPDYASLSTQIDAVKSEITSSLAASSYTAQDLIFIAGALDKLGTMLGVNDIVAATADKISSINSTYTTNLNSINSTYTTNLASINSTYTTNLGNINTASTMAVVTKTGSFTLAKTTDQNQTLFVNSASDVTCTIPANSSEAFDVGAVIEVIQGGAGRVTFSGAGGVVIYTADSLVKTRKQYASGSLVKIATDTWILGGDLGA